MRIIRPMEEILTEGPQWQDRPDRQRVPVERWGRSHWGLLGFIDDRVVRWKGLIDWDHVQVSRKHWPMLHAAKRRMQLGFEASKDGADYGLMLKPDQDGRPGLLEDHCEVDAMMDLADAGLVTIQMPEVSASGQSYLRPDGHALNDPSPLDLLTGQVEWLLMPWAKLGFSELGWGVAAALRRHKGDGGVYARFEMPAELKSGSSRTEK